MDAPEIILLRFFAKAELRAFVGSEAGVPGTLGALGAEEGENDASAVLTASSN